MSAAVYRSGTAGHGRQPPCRRVCRHRQPGGRAIRGSSWEKFLSILGRCTGWLCYSDCACIGRVSWVSLRLLAALRCAWLHEIHAARDSSRVRSTAAGETSARSLRRNHSRVVATPMNAAETEVSGDGASNRATAVAMGARSGGAWSRLLHRLGRQRNGVGRRAAHPPREGVDRARVGSLEYQGRPPPPGVGRITLRKSSRPRCRATRSTSSIVWRPSTAI